MGIPKRKRNRLAEYDYSSPNAYFITICTVQRRNLFWANAGVASCRPQAVQLSYYGRIVDVTIKDIGKFYTAVTVDNYVIMPNHVHLLLRINPGDGGRPLAAPTVSTIINQMKGVITKRIGFSVWQKGFHDHVIRGESDYQEIWEYIEANPSRWIEDKLYTESFR